MTVFIITGNFKGKEVLMIIGDFFVGRSVDYFYVNAKSDMYGDANFRVQAYAADELAVLNPFALGRLRNAFVAALNESLQAPKLVLIIIEDDLIKGIKFEKDLEVTEKILYKVFNKVCKWLCREVFRLMECYLEEVPSKAKNKVNPVICWVTPTYHKDYPDNWERKIFAKCLASAVKGKKNMSTFDLKHQWDDYDHAAYSKERGKLTDHGLINYWSAVDKAVRSINGTLEQQAENTNSSMTFRGGFYGVEEDLVAEVSHDHHVDVFTYYRHNQF